MYKVISKFRTFIKEPRSAFGSNNKNSKVLKNSSELLKSSKFYTSLSIKASSNL